LIVILLIYFIYFRIITEGTFLTEEMTAIMSYLRDSAGKKKHTHTHTHTKESKQTWINLKQTLKQTFM